MAFCCLCEQPVSRWLPHPQAAQRSAFMSMMETVGSDLSVFSCPHCHSTDRDRHLWLYMNAAELPAQIAGASVLHLAPELHIERRIEQCQPGRYVRGDLVPSRPNQLCVDVEAMQFEDNSFDLILCNHVLEHVGQPLQALRELRRCLKPGGVLIAQTPYSPLLKRAMELSFSPPPQAFASLFFGQADHVRLFGADIADYFAEAGLEGALLPHEALLEGFDAAEFGCNAREPFFGFSKALS
jgi:SAM-dependent methyltransferase